MGEPLSPERTAVFEKWKQEQLTGVARVHDVLGHKVTPFLPDYSTVPETALAEVIDVRRTLLGPLADVDAEMIKRFTRYLRSEESVLVSGQEPSKEMKYLPNPDNNIRPYLQAIRGKNEIDQLGDAVWGVFQRGWIHYVMANSSSYGLPLVDMQKQMEQAYRTAEFHRQVVKLLGMESAISAVKNPDDDSNTINKGYSDGFEGLLGFHALEDGKETLWPVGVFPNTQKIQTMMINTLLRIPPKELVPLLGTAEDHHVLWPGSRVRHVPGGKNNNHTTALISGHGNNGVTICSVMGPDKNTANILLRNWIRRKARAVAEKLDIGHVNRKERIEDPSFGGEYKIKEM